MTNYYLDIETTGLDPTISKILTIQYQELDFNTGEQIGELIILKSWESSEKEILEKFEKVFNKGFKWDFVAHGYNLHFEHNFLLKRSEIHGVNEINLFSKPTIDLHPVGIMMNKGYFKGSALNKITGKVGNGFDIIEMHSFGDYDNIIEYIIQEAREYIKFYVWMRKNGFKLLEQYKQKNGK